jgi:hypothetical protein
MLAADVPAANAAGIVTHAWMALEAIDRVQPPALRQLLDAHRDQVRAGAEFPDGGYWTRSLGTPGGDYGEEAHWQRFHDGYVAKIRGDAACAPRLRDLETGQLVGPAGGYPRIVPYNSEAGEHVIAFQPANDLAPCRWYQVETTAALIDARQRPVTPSTWRFQTSGCGRGTLARPIRGTITCDATGSFTFRAGLTSDKARARGRITFELTNCDGGQNGSHRSKSSLPIAGGVADLDIGLAAFSCEELTAPSGPARIRGRIRWLDAQGKPLGSSSVKSDDFDVRGGVTTIRERSGIFPSHALALRIAPDLTGCETGGRTVLPITNGQLSAWP